MPSPCPHASLSTFSKNLNVRAHFKTPPLANQPSKCGHARMGEGERTQKVAMSTLNQQRKVVEQLRLEAGLHRRPVSECIRDMIGFIEQYRDKDCLVNGFASKKDNPFQEKGGCQLL
ncbi:Guanine nucleotide-binding protein subunit gamma-1 [Echinococcus granulosus]|nr:Guanine nucleotide-binding protein subunit gamma-1 [Echinococcus granulosus]